MALTLGQAARLTGHGKSTLTRAIKAGRLSASRRDDGSYEIDPAELSRVYSIRTDTPETVAQPSHAVHHAPPSGDPDVTARLAALEAEIAGLKDLVEEVKRSRDKAEAACDQWRGQAERLALRPPTPEPKAETRHSWWQWRRVG
jgi:hypothetical protein